MLIASIIFTLFLIAACWVPRDPSQCNFIGALIGAGASLIGGALNRREQRKANADAKPKEQVREWEAAGINPILGITKGSYIPPQAASIGDSFATAGSQLARALELDQEKDLRETELSKENDKLREKLDDLANPQQPGYLQRYGAIMPLPSFGEDGVQSIQGDDRSGSGTNVHPSGDELFGGVLPGVNRDDVVHGTVPYVGMSGDVIPGPNPETQIGIDEVLGWGLLEATAKSKNKVNWYLDHARNAGDWIGGIAADIGERVSDGNWPYQREVDPKTYRNRTTYGFD